MPATHSDTPSEPGHAAPRSSLGAKLVWLGKVFVFVITLGMVYPQVFSGEDEE